MGAILEDWGSEYGKNPNISKTPKGEPYMKTGDTVKDEPPLNKILPEQRHGMEFQIIF